MEEPKFRAEVEIPHGEYIVTARFFEGSKGQTLVLRDSATTNVVNMSRREIEAAAKKMLQQELHNIQISPDCKTILFKSDSLRGEVIRKLVPDNTADGAALYSDREVLNDETGLKVEQLNDMLEPVKMPVATVSLNETFVAPMPEGRVLRRPEEPAPDIKPADDSPVPNTPRVDPPLPKL